MRWLYLWMAESGNLVERNDLGRTSVQFDVLLKGVRLCEERYWVGDDRNLVFGSRMSG